MNYANRRKLRVGDTLIVLHYEPKVDENESEIIAEAQVAIE